MYMYSSILAYMGYYLPYLNVHTHVIMLIYNLPFRLVSSNTINRISNTSLFIIIL